MTTIKHPDFYIFTSPFKHEIPLPVVINNNQLFLKHLQNKSLNNNNHYILDIPYQFIYYAIM